MSSNYKISRDLNEAKSMAENLSDYVRGDELYGYAEGGFFSRMPSLTIGALLMRLRRLDAMRNTLNDSQERDLESAIATWQETRNDWRLHYEEKVVREVESRLQSMKTFFRECADSLQNCHNSYRPEIQKRTIIQELLNEMAELNLSNVDVKALLEVADTKLHSVMRPDEFQWSPELEAIYPQSEFWWLYQKPPKSNDEK